MRLPAEALRSAWAHALRFPLEPNAASDPSRHGARLDDGTVLAVRIDVDGPARWARVTAHRDDPPLTHAEAVPLAAEAFVLGRFEPFEVESVAGADGRTWHYAIDLTRYCEARAERLLHAASALLGAGAPPAEVHYAARQMGCPFPALAASADMSKAAAREPRTLAFLANRFHLPAAWIEGLVDDFVDARREGQIDAAGQPRASGRDDR